MFLFNTQASVINVEYVWIVLIFVIVINLIINQSSMFFVSNFIRLNQKIGYLFPFI